MSSTIRLTSLRVPGSDLTLAALAWEPPGGAPNALPVLLLHGLTGRAGGWEGVAAVLARTRPVLALDARGHGDSDWSADTAYAGDAHFADVATALTALGIQRCVIVGYSMGGGVAILTAAALPERVAGLVVVDAYAAPEMTPGSRRIAEVVASAYGDGRSLPPGFDPAIARQMRDDLAAGDVARMDLWPFWEAGTCPAVLVRGGLSDVLPAPLAARMIARRPSARLVTLADAGHPIPFTHPADLAAIIERLAREIGDTAWESGTAGSLGHATRAHVERPAVR